MARKSRTVQGGEEFSALLAKLADENSGYGAVVVMRAACYAGAEVLANAIKAEIQDLPEQEGYMPNGRKRNIITSYDKSMLQRRLGVSKIEATGEKASVAVGFNGYNDKPTKKYPKGVPIPLIARSIESGSSVRQKNPFIRRAFNNAKTNAQQKAIDAGQEKLNELIK